MACISIFPNCRVSRRCTPLGAKFDIRKFHDALIDDGLLPLDLLERRIDEWIKRQQ
jgi:uncharacterized protein (DUF885 family)